MATNLNVLRTPLAAILLAAKTQLMAQTGFPANRVYLSLTDQPPVFQNDQDLIVRPLDPAPDPEFQVGAGTSGPVIVRPLLVTVRSRAVVDLAYQDDISLTDAAIGHLALEEQVLAAFWDFFPVDANNNALVIQPFLFSPSLKPVHPDKSQFDWTASYLTWEMRYQANVPNTGL